MAKTLNPDWLRRSFSYDKETGVIRRSCGTPTGTLNKSGYIYIGIKDKRVGAHRLAWFLVTGSWPETTVDHINRVKSDNRWCNLRLASRNQQGYNREANRNSTSRYKGVSLYRKTKWRAYARIDGVGKHIGIFNTELEAKLAYDNYVHAAHGEFFCSG